MPLRVTISPRTLEKQSVEVKPRAHPHADLVPLARAVSDVCERLGR